MNKKWGYFMLPLAFTLVLAGCGTAGNSAQESQPTTATTENTAGPVTVTDDHGEVKLDQPAKRVVVLEWTFAEDLIAVGVQPVGNADTADYKLWVTPDAALDASVTDVGTRAEPNLEAIAALKPDLIIETSDNTPALYDQLKAIAPTLDYNMYKDKGYDYDRMVEVFNEIAKAVGKEDQAKQVLADLDTHYDDAKEQLKTAGKEGMHYALTQAFTSQNAASLRMFTDNSVVVDTLDNIGLVNDWKSDQFEQYGFSTVGIESLSKVKDSSLLYIVQPDDDVFGAPMKNNSVWNQLDFVKEKRTYALDGTTWTFGGPISSKVLVDQVVGAVTK
ncbi:ABC transporter substrate-binding protein [Paenibacillus sp. WLX1005]|uniref:ABC transporter substrate-binding protein n=1 Tax=Paenibacillus sp. WLX1005 TaxID=3243766 RepID=UPI0039842F37